MLLKNATLLDLSNLSLREGLDVSIEGNRIVRIAPCDGREGTGARPDPRSAEDEVIDARGMYLLPGLVNTHAHTAMTLLRGAAEDIRVEDWFNKHVWVFEQNLTAEDVYVGTLLGAAEMLLNGVTCVADHYFAMDQAYRAFQESGMRADLSWAVFGTGDNWQTEYENSLGFVSDHRDRDPRLRVSLGPHSPYICSDTFLKRVAAEADSLELKLHIHVSEEQGQVERCLSTCGETPVAVLDKLGLLRPGTILAHAYWATDRDLALIRERGAGIAHCAKTYLKFGDVNDFLPRALASSVAVGLGTDGPCSNNTLNIFETARQAALLAKSARKDPELGSIGDILPLLVSGGQLLGLANYGLVEEGALADLVLIDPRTPNMMPECPFANLLYALDGRNIDTVIVDGKLVVRRGKLLTFDTEPLYRRANQIRRRLIEQASGGPMQTY